MLNNIKPKSHDKTKSVAREPRGPQWGPHSERAQRGPTTVTHKGPKETTEGLKRPQQTGTHNGPKATRRASRGPNKGPQRGPHKEGPKGPQNRHPQRAQGDQGGPQEAPTNLHPQRAKGEVEGLKRPQRHRPYIVTCATCDIFAWAKLNVHNVIVTSETYTTS